MKNCHAKSVSFKSEIERTGENGTEVVIRTWQNRPYRKSVDEVISEKCDSHFSSSRYRPMRCHAENLDSCQKIYIDKMNIRKTFEHVNDRHSFRSARHVGFPPINVAISRIHRMCLLSNRVTLSVQHFAISTEWYSTWIKKKCSCKPVHQIHSFRFFKLIILENRWGYIFNKS